MLHLYAYITKYSFSLTDVIDYPFHMFPLTVAEASCAW
jgi:hypothetical protein